MKPISVIRALNLLFLGLMFAFIIFYFAELVPAKKEAACAENSTRLVLGTNSTQDPFDLYNQLYKNCLTQAK